MICTVSTAWARWREPMKTRIYRITVIRPVKAGPLEGNTNQYSMITDPRSDSYTESNPSSAEDSRISHLSQPGRPLHLDLNLSLSPRFESGTARRNPKS